MYICTNRNISIRQRRSGGGSKTNLRNPRQESIRVPPSRRNRREEALNLADEVARDGEGAVEPLTGDETLRRVEDVVEERSEVFGGEIGDLDACGGEVLEDERGGGKEERRRTNQFRRSTRKDPPPCSSIFVSENERKR